MLGVSWTRDELVSFKNNKGKNNSSKEEQFFIPLALAINPNFLDGFLEKLNPASGPAGYNPEKNEEIVSLADISREDYMKLIGKEGKNGR